MIRRFIFFTLLKIGKFIGKKPKSLEEQREIVTQFSKTAPLLIGAGGNVQIEDLTVEGIPLKYVASHKESKEVLFFIHGGGHVFSYKHIYGMYKPFISLIATQTKAEIWAPDYRVAPEDPLPSGLDDCYKIYKYLLGKGIPANQITFLGDSAGGGLVLSLLLRIRDEKLPVPKGAIILSAWTDLALTGQSHKTREGIDPMFSTSGIALNASRLVNKETMRLPDRSPLYGDLAGLPPLLMFVGGRELLHDDTTMFAEKAQNAGVEVRVIDEEKMFHVYPIYANIFPEGMAAIGEMAKFVNR